MAYKDIEKQKLFQREWKRKKNLENKLKAIEMLGGECSHEGCSVTDFSCLEFDHIKPVKRKGWGNSGIANANLVARGILTKDDVQLLCSNHHSIKTYVEDRMTFANYIS